VNPNASIRYALIGSGMMGGEHILNLRQIPRAEVVAIAEPDEGARTWGRACCEGRYEPRWFRTHTELLEAVGGEVDVIIVASPNMTHFEIMVDVMSTNSAIMCEKPLCTTAADALEIHRLASQRAAMTWTALEYRYMPTIEKFIELARGGASGSPAMLRITEHRFPFLPKIDNWNRFTANTGGTLVEKCCHFFDLMRLTLQANPVSVFAVGGQRVNHLDERYDGRVPDILDHAVATVSFDNGASGLLDLSMFAEGAAHEQELALVGDTAKVDTTVPGGSVWVRPRQGSPAEVAAPMPAEVTYEGFHHGSSMREHLRLIACLDEGRQPEVSVADGVWSVAMGEAAHRSIERGGAVQLVELLGTDWMNGHSLVSVPYGRVASRG
jgi:myo-inositol 2-dehydrogenase/D-chiro-inositol 1-dehydrogenase